MAERGRGREGGREREREGGGARERKQARGRGRECERECAITMSMCGPSKMACGHLRLALPSCERHSKKSPRHHSNGMSVVKIF